MPCRRLARVLPLIVAADGSPMGSLCYAADSPIIADVLVLLTVAAGGGTKVHDESGARRCLAVTAALLSSLYCRCTATDLL
ncbi:hypothetical protein PR003_g15169 [Phytophthora rubi]|uniref:Uncharacterized protein n=1 Tax=Phytophthora rubi TaxID=129364 RepID=A0A6A3KQR0_9STRA|nr:hypothetical protein PR001_g17267 [Phytophthora rubi]KAE9012525.1 hypothetical protein PR002_g14779 [Phytophthora rubi]KAE9331101.1 hypothetical protein PR003_g15169 [Phytophthora rubi]